MLLPEQNSVGCMMDLLAEISSLGALVGHSFAETISGAKTCLLFSELQRFLGCKKDEVCFKEALPGLVEVYIPQVLSSESDLTAKQENCIAARLFLAEMDWIQARRKEDIWSAPIRLLPVQ